MNSNRKINIPATTAIEIAAKLGYTVTVDDDEIRYIDQTDRAGYLPEIQHSFDGAWQIQTCSYGAKGTSEIEEIIAGYNKAIQMVNYLEAWTD